MSLTAILFLILYITGLVLTFKNPYFGIPTYVFEWHNHPPYQWWGGALPDLRWSMVVAAATLLSLIINYHKLNQLQGSSYRPIWWLVCMCIWMYFISAFYALNPEESYKKSEIYLKFTIQTFLMMFLIRSIREYRVVIWTLILCVANFGKISWERGSNRYLGVIAPNSTEENAISAHVVSALPLFGLYFLTGKKWTKIITLISMPFLVNLVILANSRASFLAALVAGILTLLGVGKGLRKKVLFGLAGGVCLFLILGHETFWERQRTIQEYTAEESPADSRHYLWAGALRMAADYPMGVGGEGFMVLAVDYVPELAVQMMERGAKTVHNTFLLVLVEWGFIGVGLFCGFLIHIFVILVKIRGDAKSDKKGFFFINSLSIALGLIGILIAGIFHNRLYSEVIYWYAAFAVALRNIQVGERASKAIENNGETVRQE
jgi:hypothetical protein